MESRNHDYQNFTDADNVYAILNDTSEQHAADVNRYAQEYVNMIASSGQINEIKLGPGQDSLLQVAIQAQKFELVIEILDIDGIDLNQKNAAGQTARDIIDKQIKIEKQADAPNKYKLDTLNDLKDRTHGVHAMDATSAKIASKNKTNSGVVRKVMWESFKSKFVRSTSSGPAVRAQLEDILKNNSTNDAIDKVFALHREKGKWKTFVDNSGNLHGLIVNDISKKIAAIPSPQEQIKLLGKFHHELSSLGEISQGVLFQGHLTKTLFDMTQQIARVPEWKPFLDAYTKATQTTSADTPERNEAMAKLMKDQGMLINKSGNEALKSFANILAPPDKNELEVSLPQAAQKLSDNAAINGMKVIAEQIMKSSDPAECKKLVKVLENHAQRFEVAADTKSGAWVAYLVAQDQHLDPARKHAIDTMMENAKISKGGVIKQGNTANTGSPNKEKSSSDSSEDSAENTVGRARRNT